MLMHQTTYQIKYIKKMFLKNSNFYLNIIVRLGDSNKLLSIHWKLLASKVGKSIGIWLYTQQSQLSCIVQIKLVDLCVYTQTHAYITLLIYKFSVVEHLDGVQFGFCFLNINSTTMNVLTNTALPIFLKNGNSRMPG